MEAQATGHCGTTSVCTQFLNYSQIEYKRILQIYPATLSLRFITDDGTLFTEASGTSNLGSLASESVAEIMIVGQVLKAAQQPDLELAKAPVRLRAS